MHFLKSIGIVYTEFSLTFESIWIFAVLVEYEMCRSNIFSNHWLGGFLSDIKNYCAEIWSWIYFVYRFLFGFGYLRDYSKTKLFGHHSEEPIFGNDSLSYHICWFNGFFILGNYLKGIICGPFLYLSVIFTVEC